MRINGKEIAEKIYQNLQSRIRKLHKRGITPHLAVLLVGEDPRSEAYVSQKQKRADHIAAKVTIYHYEKTTSTELLAKKIQELNTDTAVHGILIQRPLPKHIDEKSLEFLVDPQKDIDGFHPDSPYTLPLPLAVVKILEEIHLLSLGKEGGGGIAWLKDKSTVILGKGTIGGKPIIDYIKKLGLDPIIIDSKTVHPENLTKKADIIISAVGKANTIKPEMLKKGVILIGVGLFQGDDGKLHGDYDEEEIKEIVSFYTPTPGGVGPVNIALLMDNLITAAENFAL